MPAADAIANLFWFFFGGLPVALVYFAAALLMWFSVYFYKTGNLCFLLAVKALAPFGTDWKSVLLDEDVLPEERYDTAGVVVLHVLYYPFLLANAIIHCTFLLVMAATVVGVPIARAHFELLPLVMRPTRQSNPFWCCWCC